MPAPPRFEERPAPASRPAAELSPAALYMDLMKRSLTRCGFGGELIPVKPSPGWRRRLWPLAQQVLDRREWVICQRHPSNPGQGLVWPHRAETMIGMRRLDNLQCSIERVVADGVPGDVLEAGVWRGGAAIFMRAALAALGETNRLVWVADSFSGLPEPDPRYEADRGDEHWSQSPLVVPLEEVKQNFSRYNLLDRQVRFLPGWFSDTLPTAPIKQLAVLRADGDMYGSTMDILSSLYPRLSVGGFAIIDDYGAVAACRAAVEDYRSEHGITEAIERIDWTGVFWRRQR